MTEINHFHQGELDVQHLAGCQEAAIKISRIIQDSIPATYNDFIGEQFVVWIGVEDENNYPSAFPLFGSPGFIHRKDEKIIAIDMENIFSIPNAWTNGLQRGKPIGCLLIDLATRARLRINGVIAKVTTTTLQIEVQQIYPNCQKYIRKRVLLEKPHGSGFHLKTSGHVLNDQAETMIDLADTAFVASLGPNGADISHRGGAAGFIQRISTNMIRIPDYKGNGLFNTLGNFKINPLGCILIIDFAEGNFLQIFGQVNIIFDKGSAIINSGETHRFWELNIDQCFIYQLTNNLAWNDLEFSSYNP